MAKRDPLTYEHGRARLPTLHAVLKAGRKQPRIGVTQGGSSRKDAGCRPAATRGVVRAQTTGEVYPGEVDDQGT